jgi:hypothetical protein
MLPTRALAALLLAGAFASVAAAAPRMPGPGPQPGSRRIARNGECVACHREIADEWADSLHRAAATDPEYRRAHAREPRRFCRECHVPEASPDVAREAAEAIGIGCVTCHWAGAGAVLAAPGPVTAAARAAHRVVVLPRMGEAAACAACHEFPFPDSALRKAPELMQETVREHAGSWARDYACADCHMPWTPDASGGHRSHRFDGSRSPEAVALAVGVAAARTGPDAVEIELSPGAAGHAFPTGDLFRRLEVRVQLLAPEGPRPPQVRWLERRFADVQDPPGVVVRAEVEDSRLTDVPVALRFSLDGHGEASCDDPAALWVAWRVSYQRVAFPVDRRRGAQAIEGEVVIAEGVLPAWSG